MSLATTLAPNFPVISSAGTIDAYIQASRQFPMLSAEEEHDLAVRFRENGDLEAARRLVLSHLRLVISVARGYLGYGLPHADLIQEGNIGLMKAVKRFDPSQGVRLVSFALHWIRAEIHDYVLKNWRQVKVATTKAQRKLFFNLRSMKEGHEAISITEAARIAKELKVKPEEVLEMETRMTGHDIALESSVDDSEDHFSPMAWLTDARTEPSAILEARHKDWLESDGLQEALAHLDERAALIVSSRYLADEPATLHELADKLGVSAERIRQIEVRALQKMRDYLAPKVA